MTYKEAFDVLIEIHEKNINSLLSYIKENEKYLSIINAKSTYELVFMLGSNKLCLRAELKPWKLFATYTTYQIKWNNNTFMEEKAEPVSELDIRIIYGKTSFVKAKEFVQKAAIGHNKVLVYDLDNFGNDYIEALENFLKTTE